jgi:1-acyl-sn-glycerol-3-phosphate acyltransferase
VVEQDAFMKTGSHSHIALHFQRVEVWMYGAYVWMLFILVLLTAGGLISVLQSPRLGRRIAHSASRMLYFLGGVTLTAEGLDRLPQQPHILLLNHSSFVDGIALSAMLPPVPGHAFVVRQQYNSQALLYPLLRGLGMLILDRHTHREHSHPNIGKLIAGLKAGNNLLLFPEGGFRPEPGLLPFHRGAFIAAAHADVPVTIAVLTGAREELCPGTWLPRRVKLCLTIGDTLVAHGKDTDAIDTLERQSYAAMQKMLVHDS